MTTCHATMAHFASRSGRTRQTGRYTLVDKVVAPCIVYEPDFRAEVICGEHVADELRVAVMTVLHEKDRRLKYGPEVTVAFDNINGNYILDYPNALTLTA